MHIHHPAQLETFIDVADQLRLAILRDIELRGHCFIQILKNKINLILRI